MKLPKVKSVYGKTPGQAQREHRKRGKGAALPLIKKGLKILGKRATIAQSPGARAHMRKVKLLRESDATAQRKRESDAARKRDYN